METDKTLSQSLAEFVVSLKTEANIPPEVMEKARVCLLNGYGIGLACFNTPFGQVAAKAGLAMDGEQADGATLLAIGRKSSMQAAMLSNSALFHGRAQEDALGAAHLGAILIPMLTAAAETGRIPLARMLPALIAGYEVGGLFEQAYAGHTTPAGLRASPIYGALASAAAASLALDLDQDHTAAALANAASFAGGILQSFADGTDEWRYQLGVAANNGWVAAQLAKAGSVSAPHAFEGKAGLVRAYARADCNVADLQAKLGTQWFIHRVVFKPYPVCAFNQTPVNAALAFRSQLKGRNPASIQVRMNPYETGYAGMDSTGPFNSVSGTLMSIPFCIANTLLHGAPTLRDMMVYDDPQVAGLIDRITLVSDQDVPRLSCVIVAEFDNGDAPETLHMNKTVDDYNYDRATLRELVLRVGAEVELGAGSCDALERFVENPPELGLDVVLREFAVARDAAARAST
ncbi:MmgE/PrpD family protein [Pollutimonas harenae]|uniref:MmgE/PrpD family protein n=1 Tax=Pollutimonas harenae TaxID=657015 RepID=A0A853GP82_9BURK|nr:MmgE/PrpD family protein [Pollutimonas harenae]NYT84848.1 MmgE/PrpD family protein [Pollutimonas harenae]TEA72754.1 MmgE/PrpD family protein 4 [Pollutimonas harenae]